MSSARAAEDTVFGDAALALAARARHPARASDSDENESVRVEFDAHDLSDQDRRILTELAGATSDLHERRSEGAEGGAGAKHAEPEGAKLAQPELGLDKSRSARNEECDARRVESACRRSDLVELSARSEAARVLLAAHDNACREPEPARVMGVVNVTPDSFSESSRFPDAERAIEHGLELVAEGARMLDIGGESSRPGASPIDAETELARVVPVIRGLARRTSAVLSIDTTKAAVAEAALESGATIVNDISAGRFDPLMLGCVSAHRAGFIAMHMQGTPQEMQARPRYRDVLTEVTEFLRRRVRACLEAGIDRARIWIDPGIGFGKNLEHNLELIARLHELRSLGLPICLGVSRKSFIASIERRAEGANENSDAEERVGGTAAAATVGVWNGASIVRVHDVRVMVQAVRVAEALAHRNRCDPHADSCSSPRGAHNRDR
jgi:dihydropteroate synthase